MADNETRVIYKAIADFTALRRAVTGARKDLKDLNKDAAAASAQQTAAGKVQEAQNGRVARSIENMRAARARHGASAVAETQAVQKEAQALAQEAVASEKAVRATNNHKNAKKGLTGTLLGGVSALLQHAAATSKASAEMDKGSRSTVRFRSGLAAMFSRLAGGSRTLGQTSQALDKLQDKISKVFTRRSQLGGLPFGLLIPLILGVISAINPLISLLGAAGGAAIGFANSLASLAGTAMALPGIFAAVASGIAGVMVAFGGVGKVFKLFSQKQASGGGGGGGGGGGQTAADRENALADAEDRVARAQRNVKKAQDNLNKARQQAIRDLEDLRKAVARASADEADAVANLQQAQENYNNVFADSGSTAGDKLKAAADLTDAQNQLDDVRQQNIRNQQDLTEAEKKGVEGSDQVRDATDNLTDALSEQRDALYALQKAQAGATGGGGGGGGGIDAFQQALDKLSPSAKAFVLGILAMKDAWDALHRSVQEEFFSRIVKDLPLISGFLPTLTNLLGKAAGAMGDVAHNGIVMITSGPWTKDFNTLADNNVGIIHDLGAALLSLLDALRNITMAAAPFTKLLTGRFAQAMENLDKLTQKSRDDGSLAAWLDKVAGRLTTWWNIIKNIGATLFNYGKAASGFGDWLTNGFERVTEGWRKASEAANDPKSGFKGWLEDIKPLLGEVKATLGDFWSWLKRTSADPKNIKTATDLLHTIRTELGPALGRLLDTMSKTGISEKLVSGVSKIVDVISKLVEKGGGAGMTAFFDILERFFDILDKIVSIPGVGETLGTIAGTLAAIAAIKFVADVSGISKLVGLLIGLAGKKGDLLSIFSSLTGLKLPSGSTVSSDGTVVVPDSKSKPKPTDPAAPIGTGKTFGIGLITDLISQAISNLIPADNNPKDGLDYNNLKNQLSGAGSGALGGSLFGIPGMLIGAGVGAAGSADPKSWQHGAEQIGDFWKWMTTNSKGVNSWQHGADQIGDFFKGITTNSKGENPWANGAKQIGDWWNGLFGGGDKKPDLSGGVGGGKGGGVGMSRGGGQQSTNPWENGAKQIGDFFGGFKMPDFGSLFSGIKLPDFGKLFSGFKMPDLGKVFTDLNPFKGIKLPDFGAIFKGQNPFGFLKLPDFGGLFKGQNPFSFLQLPDFGSVFKGQNPFGWLKLPDFGGVFKGQVPGIKWPGFSDLFSGKIPGLSWPGFSSLFSGKIPGLSWPNFGSIFGGVLPSAWTIANQVYQAVANAFSNVGGWLRSIFGSKGGAVKNGAKARKNKPTPGGGGPVNTGTGGRGKGAKAFWTGGYAALAGGGRALENRPGSERPRQVGTDTVPAMLTLGEFVLRKGVVDSIGTKNLNALNEGLISYSDMLNMAMGNQKTQQAQKSKIQPMSATAYLSGGGLAGNAIQMPNRLRDVSPSQVPTQTSVSNNSQDTHIGSVTINNPRPERASDTLPRTIRKTAYLGDRKPANVTPVGR